ncbi:hypothetical protein LCGC14_1771170, partial [marine sediment metagenome]
MAVENYTPKAVVSHTQSRSASHTQTDTGDGTEAYDNDFGTNYGTKSKRGSGGGNTTTATCNSEHTWTTSITVPKIKVYVYSAGKAEGNYAEVNNTVYVDLKISGAWTRIATATRSGTGSSGTLYETTLNTT